MIQLPLPGFELETETRPQIVTVPRIQRDRAWDVLTETFYGENMAKVHIADLSELIGTPRTTIRRTVLELERSGYVMRESERTGVHLTPTGRNMVSSYIQALDMFYNLE